MPSLDDALGYLARGWSVVPAHVVTDYTCSCNNPQCPSAGKHPRTGWKEYQEKAPSADEVRRWWSARYPNANLALLTGRVSGVVVLDIDPRHGGDEALAAWQARNGPLPETPQALTGGGGQHFFFRYPGVPVKSSANVMPGVDVRGDAGIIILPPSMHSSGRSYEWDTSAHPDDIPLAAMPAALLALANSTVTGRMGESVEIRLNIDAVIEGTQTVAEGARNDAMARVIGQLAATLTDLNSVHQLAAHVNAKSFRPPLEDDELGKIVESIVGRERTKQRAARETVTLLTNSQATLDTENLPETDRVAIAAALWAECGVPVLTDWYILRGGRNDCVLVTPDQELHLGENLLDYFTIREHLLMDNGVLMPWDKKPADWSLRALHLRQLAREEVVDHLRASEQIDEWVEQYILTSNTREYEPDMIRDALHSGPVLIKGVLHLQIGKFMAFIERVFGEKVGPPQLRKMLTSAGWHAKPIADGNGSSVRTWSKTAEDDE